MKFAVVVGLSSRIWRVMLPMDVWRSMRVPVALYWPAGEVAGVAIGCGVTSGLTVEVGDGLSVGLADGVAVGVADGDGDGAGGALKTPPTTSSAETTTTTTTIAPR